MAGSVQDIVDKVKNAESVLVTVNKDPTVDQLSAALALTVILDKMEKRVASVFSGKMPPAISFLKPETAFSETPDSLREFIIALDKEKADHLRYTAEGDFVKIYITPYKSSLSQKDLEFSHGDYGVDLVILIGVEDETHLDSALSNHGKIMHDATIVSLSTREMVSEMGSMKWHDNTVSSYSEMILFLENSLEETKSLLDEQVATALLTGIVAETKRFSNEKTTANSLTVAAKLMAAGANQQLVAAKLTPVTVDEREDGALKAEPRKEKKEDESEFTQKPTDASEAEPSEFEVDKNNEDTKESTSLEKKAKDPYTFVVDNHRKKESIKLDDYQDGSEGKTNEQESNSVTTSGQNSLKSALGDASSVMNLTEATSSLSVNEPFSASLEVEAQNNMTAQNPYAKNGELGNTSTSDSLETKLKVATDKYHAQRQEEAIKVAKESAKFAGARTLDIEHNEKENPLNTLANSNQQSVQSHELLPELSKLNYQPEENNNYQDEQSNSTNNSEVGVDAKTSLAEYQSDSPEEHTSLPEPQTNQVENSELPQLPELPQREQMQEHQYSAYVGEKSQPMMNSYEAEQSTEKVDTSNQLQDQKPAGHLDVSSSDGLSFEEVPATLPEIPEMQSPHNNTQQEASQNIENNQSVHHSTQSYETEFQDKISQMQNSSSESLQSQVMNDLNQDTQNLPSQIPEEYANVEQESGVKPLQHERVLTPVHDNVQAGVTPASSEMGSLLDSQGQNPEYGYQNENQDYPQSYPQTGLESQNQYGQYIVNQSPENQANLNDLDTSMPLPPMPPMPTFDANTGLPPLPPTEGLGQPAHVQNPQGYSTQSLPQPEYMTGNSQTAYPVQGNDVVQNSSTTQNSNDPAQFKFPGQ